jgi:hypothetical protein
VNGRFKLFGSTVAALAMILGATNCGGGGSGSAVPAKPASSSTTGQTPVAYATLTIGRPANFFTAKNGGSSTSSHARKPAYINPGPSYYIALWNSTYDSTPSLVVPVFQVSGGTTLQVPLYSDNYNDFVAIEYASDPTQGTATILAIGETDIDGFTAGGGSGFTTNNATPVPGGGPAITITMQMNAANLGVMDEADNSDNSAAVNPGSIYLCASPDVFFFEADTVDGSYSYLNGTVSGGVDVPTLVSQTSYGQPPYNQGANVLTPLNGSGLSIGYYADEEYSGEGQSNYISATVNAANPAAPLFLDAINQTGSYPGIDWLKKSGTANVWLPTNSSSVQSIIGPMTVQIYNTGC